MPIERLTRPFQMFLSHRLAGAGFLLVATVVALWWANSSYAHYYEEWLHTYATIGIGDLALTKSVTHWVNDGLMGVFFFVVGLEIKREFLAGELASPKQAALPIFAAIGGMVMPALVYFAINPEGDARSGWGITMATDIAFALGLLALFPVSISLKVFLTALAIVDDIGAILVVAIFYTDDIALQSLAIGGLVLAISVAANLSGVRNPVIYFVMGGIVWLAFLKSGVHATLAAVLMAFTIPAKTRIDGIELHEQTDDLLRRLRETGLPEGKRLLSNEQHHLIHSMAQLSERATAPLQELEHALMPFVTFMIMPVFALANAGVVISSNIATVISHPIVLGIIAGLLVGKPLGIWLFSFAAVKLKIAELPTGVSMSQIAAVGFLGGIGFTMALFISTLAFPDGALVEIAKTGVLVASLASALVGALILYFTTRSS
jgi:NhaA family Na+:H+ antiporter